MKTRMHKEGHRKERGQGLVETALILPFLLILVIGIVEVGLALNRQLTVVNAAREGARFGAKGATAADIHAQTLESTSDMFEFTEDNSVVAVIHATTNADGTDFLPGLDGWKEDIHGGMDLPHVTQAEVLGDLREEGGCDRAGTSPCPYAASLKLVVVDVRYDHQAMLGLPFVSALADQIPIGSWTAMRLAAPPAIKSPCCALPIALNVETVKWDEGGLPEGTEMVDIRGGEGPGQFGWLFWGPDKIDGKEPNSAQALSIYLKDPCRAWEKFQDACDGDTTLTPDSWVWGDGGQSVSAGVEGALDYLMDQDTAVPVPIWDEFAQCNDLKAAGECDLCKPGSKVAHIVGFAMVRITEYDLTGNPKTVSGTFEGFWHGCDE